MRARRLVLGALVVAGCTRDAETPAPAPHAEFIIAAADSVYWVRSDESGIRVRGAPMVLAQIGGRFVELYVTDEDHSFYDAVYVGQRLFKRDLITGDSVSLLADTLMPVLARAYAAANPDERPLSPDEEGMEDPRTIATAEVMVLDAHGPWLSYEYRTDVDVIGGPSSHGSRRGVLDLRTGAMATLEALFGAPAARRAQAEGKARWGGILDSLRSAAAGAEQTDEVREEVRDELERLSFDPRSFVIGSVDREPQVRFSVVQSAARNAGGSYELEGIAVPEPRWWSTVRQSYPIEEIPEERIWPRTGFTLVARDASANAARTAFLLRDDRGEEWRLGSVPTPVLRVMWIVDSLLTPGTRTALTRAFNESAFYSEDVRIVRHSRRTEPETPLMRHAAATHVPVVTRRHALRDRP